MLEGGPGLPTRIEPALEQLRTTISECHHTCPGRVDWWVRHAGVRSDEVAAGAALRCDRELLQLRRPLPVQEASGIATRPFRPGVDDAAWIEANNRAFAWHEDQGGLTAEQLRDRIAEHWFDAAGFLLHEVDGRLAGFCWTKIHADEDPPLGEIYVIAVDPDFAGRGLGRALTLAGLEHLHAVGLEVGMLYVEADNAPARGLYRSLGFRVHHVDRRYTGTTRGDPDERGSAVALDSEQ